MTIKVFEEAEMTPEEIELILTDRKKFINERLKEMEEVVKELDDKLGDIDKLPMSPIIKALSGIRNDCIDGVLQMIDYYLIDVDITNPELTADDIEHYKLLTEWRDRFAEQRKGKKTISGRRKKGLK